MTTSRPRHLSSTMPLGGRLRVLIVEPDVETRQGLTRAVRSDPSLELVGVAPDCAAAVTIAEERRADVALINARLPAGGGIEAVMRLYALPARTRSIAMSDGEDLAELAAMFAAGAIGYLPQGAMATRVTEALRQAVDGQVRIPRDLARPLFARLLEGIDHEGAGERAARREREAVIRRIIDERQFDMVFQPIVSLADNAVIGVEALARFTTEERRSPDLWLDDAQTLGLRPQLEAALAAAAVEHCPRLGPQTFITVNLSPEAALSGLLADALPRESLGQIVVELTDHRQVSDYVMLGDALAELRAGGLRVAVDDSGHGLSSLQEVIRLAPDFIKLNRTLTRDVDRDSTRRALVFALSTIAADSGAEVIAEGIETAAEYAALRDLRIPYGQGYLIARPQPLPATGRLEVTQAGGAEPLPAPRRAVPDVSGKLRTVREASRAIFGLLEKELPGGTFVVSQLDHGADRWRVVAARDRAGRVEPGLNLALDESLCHPMVSGRSPRLCNDVQLEPVYAALRMAHELDISSYAGVPLETPAGGRLGTLVAISPEPDAFTERDLDTLHAMAGLVLRALDTELAQRPGVSAIQHLRDVACNDELTGALNRPSFGRAVEQASARLVPSTTFVLEGSLDELDEFTARSGRAVVDVLAKTMASTLGAVCEPLDVIGRTGDAHVTALLLGRDTAQLAGFACATFEARVRSAMAKRGLKPRIVARVRPWSDAVARELLSPVATTTSTPVAA
jgi:EAL domain-containing protein (putative c-di-GMP-specific phosphodiesterase class I)/DNA-binding NarL/FixJ family response regulator/GGDEF domain-containing protein